MVIKRQCGQEGGQGMPTFDDARVDDDDNFDDDDNGDNYQQGGQE